MGSEMCIRDRCEILASRFPIDRGNGDERRVLAEADSRSIEAMVMSAEHSQKHVFVLLVVGAVETSAPDNVVSSHERLMEVLL